MNWKNRFFFAIALSMAMVIAGCGSDVIEGPPPPDVSNIKVDVQLRRFEKDLFAMDTLQPVAGWRALEARYPEFADILARYVLRIRPGAQPDTLAEANFLSGFIRFPAARHLYDTIQVVYPDLEAYERDLEMALRYFKYHFPGQPQPETITTFLSEYSLAAFIYGNNDLAVGLDMFLGADYPYVKYNPGNTSFSEYLIRTYNRDHLLSKTLIPLVEDLVGEPSGERLLDIMVNNGKKLYILDQLLPTASDTVIMEVTPDQWAWLQNNELEIWGYFLKQNLLYNTSWPDIRKLVEPSPNSPGMPPEAPGRSANWMGWQIVKAYMSRHPQTSLEALIGLRDAQQLLEASRYKPQKQ